MIRTILYILLTLLVFKLITTGIKYCIDDECATIKVFAILDNLPKITVTPQND